MSSMRTLKLLLNELKLSYNGNVEFTKSPIYEFVMAEFRYNKLTDAQKCARENEARHLAETYINYLQNTRKHLNLIDKYKSQEKSTEEAAKLVGLALPENSN